MIKSEGVRMYVRGIGLDQGVCAWCVQLGWTDERGLLNNFAAGVHSEQHAHAALEMFRKVGMVARYDDRRADEGRHQVKVMACNVHLINLRLLSVMIQANQELLNESILKYSIVEDYQKRGAW